MSKLEKFNLLFVFTVTRFPCSSRDRAFDEDESLQKHMRSKHVDGSKKKKFACTECEYSCDHKGDYQKHLVSHTKVKAHKCDTCDKSFTLKSSLTNHIKTVHTKESKHECQICKKVFTEAGSLRRHVKSVHDKIRSYVCTECDKTFTQSGHLKTHMRTHTKEKPYQCTFCDKTFTTATGRLTHQIRIHTKNYPHVCEICKKGFVNLNRLNDHVKKCIKS